MPGVIGQMIAHQGYVVVILFYLRHIVSIIDEQDQFSYRMPFQFRFNPVDIHLTNIVQNVFIPSFGTPRKFGGAGEPVADVIFRKGLIKGQPAPQGVGEEPFDSDVIGPDLFRVKVGIGFPVIGSPTPDMDLVKFE